MSKKNKPKAPPAEVSLEVDPARYLLRGPWPDIKKMSKKELIEECRMWRNVWQWIPDEVKYYVSRTGQTVGVTMRNYKRLLGILLETHWTLREIEIGTYDKVYDQRDGRYYFERKIVKINANALIDLQWIAERTPEEEILEEATKRKPQSVETERFTQEDLTPEYEN
jgi:hypothetical protein